MNQTSNPLDQLANITVGDPISWWPLAWGWWLLISLCLLALLWSIYTTVKYRKFTKVKRETLNHLAALDRSSADYFLQAHALLRRCAIHYYSVVTTNHNDYTASGVANLSGQTWRQFLFNTLQNSSTVQSKLSLINNAEDVVNIISGVEQALYLPSDNAPKSDKATNTEACYEAMKIWLNKAIPAKAQKAATTINKQELSRV